MTIFAVIFLSAVTGCACVLLALIVRARNKRHVLSIARGVTCDTPGGAGISVLCSGVSSLRQVENLLSEEYARYEVVIVLDSRLYPAEFEALVARYRIIGVEYVPSDELPVVGVRSLGRSRRRCFRRLVLIDRAQDTPEGDFDAATGVAAYDFVLPVLDGQYLLQDAVRRLITELVRHAPDGLRMVRSWIGEPMTLLSRETVVAAGGFGSHLTRSVPRSDRKVLWEPFFAPPQSLYCGNRSGRLIGAVLLGVAILVAAVSGWWLLVALLLTAAVIWGAAECAALAFADVVAPCFGGLVAWRRHLRKLSV